MEVNRRGFLSGLFGVSVIAALPVAAAEVLAITPAPAPLYDLGARLNIQAPPGWTYNWVRSALLGEPDPENVQRRLDLGWRFVEPSRHPELAAMPAEEAVDAFGLILMEKQTALIDKLKGADPWKALDLESPK